MARFYFDIRDNKSTVRDTEGVDCATIEEAIVEARRALHEIASDLPTIENSAIAIDIREGDRSLATIMTSTSIVPSASRLRFDARSGKP
jgi:hypothetical protein